MQSDSGTLFPSRCHRSSPWWLCRATWSQRGSCSSASSTSTSVRTLLCLLQAMSTVPTTAYPSEFSTSPSRFLQALPTSCFLSSSSSFIIALEPGNKTDDSPKPAYGLGNSMAAIVALGDLHLGYLNNRLQSHQAMYPTTNWLPIVLYKTVATAFKSQGLHSQASWRRGWNTLSF